MMNKDSASILVVSDSHGNIPALTVVLAWARQVSSPGQEILPQDTDFAAAIFLGDGGDDIERASAEAGFAVPWYKVRGNLDHNFSIQDFLVLEINRKLFLAHGNRYAVDSGGQTIAAAAKAAGAEAALFGHTHTPHCSMVNGIFLLNPGSIGRSRSDAGPTFAVLECPAKGPLSARFYSLVSKGRKLEVRELEMRN